MSTESAHQKALVSWLRLQPGGRLVFAVPNGGRRDAITGARLRAEGVLPGIPDLMLPVMRGNCGGLWIEMKAPGGRLSAEQREICTELAVAGYAVLVADDWERAASHAQSYLRGSVAPGLFVDLSHSRRQSRKARR